MNRQTSAVISVLLLVVACGDAETSTPNAVSCAGALDADKSSVQLDADVVEPEQALDMSIARVLGTDQRFTWFHVLAEQTMSPMGLSWLDIWDFPGSRMGDNSDGVTVFVPVDHAFARLEPAMSAALEEGQLDNDLRYSLLGHHYVHRLYASSEFESGAQRTWRGGGNVELTLEPPTWGGCPILQTDLRLANGFIHAIGGIVMPREVREAVG